MNEPINDQRLFKTYIIFPQTVMPCSYNYGLYRQSSVKQLSCKSDNIAMLSYLEISDCVLLSPSTVNGEAPVNNSYVRTPSDHQSTACKRKQ